MIDHCTLNEPYRQAGMILELKSRVSLLRFYCGYCVRNREFVRNLISYNLYLVPELLYCGFSLEIC